MKPIVAYSHLPRSCVLFRIFLTADAAKRPGLVSQTRPLLIDLGCPAASTAGACATDSTQVGQFFSSWWMTNDQVKCHHASFT